MRRRKQKSARSADMTSQSSGLGKAPAPSLVNDVIKSDGQPLDEATRSFMEARLGHDFSRVRVHADSRAAESTDSVGAQAYTVGDHVAFAAARFNPTTEEGRKLLAHELTHVAQQANHVSVSTNLSIGEPSHPAEAEADRVAQGFGPANALPMPQMQLAAPVLQRSKEKKPKRVNVALVFDDDRPTMAEAEARAGTIIRAYSVKDAREKLIALGVPIGTLYVFSHGNRIGEIMIFAEEGTVSFVPITTLGTELKGSLPADQTPVSVDFRGCKIGEAGDELEEFRQSVGASEATATNCWTFTVDSTPIIINENEITEASQVPPDMAKAFSQGILDQIKNMTTDDGHPVGHCLVGLKRGEHPNRTHLKKLKEIYFQNKGRFVASWASEENNRNWQPTSVCMKDMKESAKKACRIVKKTAPKK